MIEFVSVLREVVQRTGEPVRDQPVSEYAGPT
jgi:hypothetical protein